MAYDNITGEILRSSAQQEVFKDPLDYGDGNNIPPGHISLQPEVIEPAKDSDLSAEDLLPLSDQAFRKRGVPRMDTRLWSHAIENERYDIATDIQAPNGTTKQDN